MRGRASSHEQWRPALVRVLAACSHKPKLMNNPGMSDDERARRCVEAQHLVQVVAEPPPLGAPLDGEALLPLPPPLGTPLYGEALLPALGPPTAPVRCPAAPGKWR